jgi:DNA-binding XRE family transcriptional regulator
MVISEFKIHRLRSGKSQWVLSHETGINRSTISLIECGHIEPNLEQKRILAKALKLPAGTLFPKEEK